MGFIIFLLLLAAMIVDRAQCRNMELIVPAYGQDMWRTLVETCNSNPDVTINIIMNPYNGVGDFPIDTFYIERDLRRGVLVDLLATDGDCKIFGYVPTQWTQVDIEKVKDEIDTYYDVAYWRGARPQMSGIVLDEMSERTSHVGYYRELTDYIHSIDPRARMIGNPGMAYVNKDGNFTIDDYLSSVDTMITFEGDGNEYRNRYEAPNWIDQWSPDSFSHVVYGERMRSMSIEDMVDLACSRNAGMLYFTDDIMDNPYDKMPSYWDDLVAAVASSDCCIADVPSVHC